MAAGSSAAPAASGSTPAVSLNDVQVSFRLADDTTYTAVQRATLDVADGEFVAIVGPTGCGKSTLLNVAAGLIAPSNGTATIFGSPLPGLNRQAGYLFQAEALFPWKTAIENVAIGLEIAGTAKTEARERAQSWLMRVGIGGFGDRYPHMLSGGQRKRVGLVQVLIRDPKILLMDEPFGALDAQTRGLMQSELLRIWQRTPKTVIFVTHDVAEAVHLADRIAVMSARPGRIKTIVETGFDRTERTERNVFKSKAFVDKVDEIWNLVRDEAIKAQERR
jgi:NitT/TauT family transport system ATP-binding protein